MMFAAVHESGCGTKRTNRVGLSTSVDWGRPEVAGRGSNDANDPFRTLDLMCT